MNNNTSDKNIIEKIVEGIQDVKGKKIVIVDMTELENYTCSYFVICQGDSNVQVNAIAENIKDHVRTELHVKPFAVDGQANAEWIAMDYGSIIVHVFQPEPRAFYQLETLWEDAKITEIEDLD
ncbi:MAG: ribosome silencing factor [Paludibacteraceae bacterium]|nr:ribosome silencing factor [Candidatus Physcocola equi]MCQ2235130.1 ribosome silencing factor [Paludibacteraceae bacterium]